MLKLRLVGYFLLTLALLVLLEVGSITPLVSAIENNHLASVKSDPARQLLKEGIKLYEMESFADARELWTSSASLYARQGDFLGQALALNNLALAYQHLGQWSESGTTIAKSLKLLNSATSKQQPGYEEILAKALNTKGNWEWATGSIEQAAATWKQAIAYYVRIADSTGIIKTKINQAKALQALGLNLQAAELLESLFQDLQQQPNLELKALGLRYLGDALRNIGKLERSEQVLLESVDLSPSNGSLGLAWLELGNTQRELSDRFSVLDKKTKAASYQDRAMQSYKTAERFASSQTLLRINLNQLSLLVESGQYDRAKTLLSSSQQNFQSQLELPATRTNIYARLNYAQSLTCLQWQAKTMPVSQQRSPTSTDNSYQTEIIEILNDAIAMAHSLNDTTVEAQAIGQLARVYELQQNFTAAKKLNQQALLLVEDRQTPDLVYILAWQLGRILKQQQPEAAIVAYQQAISSLETVRGNILYIDPQVQFDFRDRIEPVYREYADLLLTTQDGTTPSQENLRQAIRAIDSLQLAELENYLGCKLSQLIKLDETVVDSTAAKIYPIILADRLAIIIEIPGQPLNFQSTKVSNTEVEATIIALQDNLSQPGKTPEVLNSAKKIYQWLFSPIESLLAASGVETLVFVPDNLLRNIPLAVLYDGQQYLLEKKYALAVSPQLELFAPAASTIPLRVLIGGVEIPQTVEGINFPEIEQVQQELIQISQQVNTNNPLLNEEFTKVNIEQKLQTGDFSAIHWKTHGIFSSNPAETFLVAYQDSIKADELQILIRAASRGGLEPIELLVLSACETARGDNRAVLGLAGLTVRAGARSTLSTLWRASDRATTLLMTEFYQQLSQPGTTKADALRQAQLSLIEREGYFAPYYWGTYVLVGGWL